MNVKVCVCDPPRTHPGLPQKSESCSCLPTRAQSPKSIMCSCPVVVSRRIFSLQHRPTRYWYVLLQIDTLHASTKETNGFKSRWQNPQVWQCCTAVAVFKKIVSVSASDSPPNLQIWVHMYVPVFCCSLRRYQYGQFQTTSTILTVLVLEIIK